MARLAEPAAVAEDASEPLVIGDASCNGQRTTLPVSRASQPAKMSISYNQRNNFRHFGSLNASKLASQVAKHAAKQTTQSASLPAGAAQLS